MPSSVVPNIVQTVSAAVPASVHWTAYVTALAVPTIALFGVCITYWQWRTADNKLKFDLFERRLAVFEAAHNFIGSIVTSGKVSQEALASYLVATRTARWVLSEPLANHLSKHLYDPALRLQCLDGELAGIQVQDERMQNIRQQREIKEALNNQFQRIEYIFAPFLQLQH